MMDIFNMLGGMGQAQQTVGNQLGTNPNQTSAAMEAAVPLLLGALTRNATQPGGLDALTGALNQHDGSALDAFGQGQVPNTQDGQKILGHVFGGQQQAAANAVGKRAGIDPQMAMQVLSMLAPLVLGYLSRQRQGQAQGGGQMQGGGDIGSILGGMLGGGAGGLGGMLGGLLGGGQQQQTQQPHYQQPQYQQPEQGNMGGLGGMLGSVLGGGQQQQGQGQYQQPQQQAPGGDLFGSLNKVLDRDGDGSGLDDLIGMFGGRR
ncbi:DUF937 domain-containing protein [Deinococcus sp. QL22]|uniref:DUF937 domain-containing protein n=1 Tax=Deinococcus sp. QL22 TaxID=2939437 RepID=UPI002017092C|nr:DUF937 domain-containing protein [Deinococcus sp. QL22]UQN06675.1 DUF937 domain-containing protein [Deinococcus sp. QL22]